MPRTVYVNPGELLRIRVIFDPDAPKTSAEWSAQSGHSEFLMKIKDDRRVLFADPAMQVETRKNENGAP